MTDLDALIAPEWSDPCRFCGGLFDSEDILQHEDTCRINSPTTVPKLISVLEYELADTDPGQLEIVRLWPHEGAFLLAALRRLQAVEAVSTRLDATDYANAVLAALSREATPCQSGILSRGAIIRRSDGACDAHL
jgi:hypothetical protein